MNNLMLKGSVADEQFNEVMRNKVEEVWRVGKQKNKLKVEGLVCKYAKGNSRDMGDAELYRVVSSIRALQ